MIQHMRQSDRNMQQLVLLRSFSALKTLLLSQAPLHAKLVCCPHCRLWCLKIKRHKTSPHGIPDTVEQTQYDKAVRSIRHCNAIADRKGPMCCMCVCACINWTEAVLYSTVYAAKSKVFRTQCPLPKQCKYCQNNASWSSYSSDSTASLHSNTNRCSAVILQALTC